MRALGATMFRTAIRMAPLLLGALALALIAGVLTGVIDKDLIPIIIALGIAMVALLFPVSSAKIFLSVLRVGTATIAGFASSIAAGGLGLKSFGNAFKSIPTSINKTIPGVKLASGGLISAIFGGTGQNGAFAVQSKGFAGKLTGLFRGLGKAGPIGAAIAAAAVIITALFAEMNKRADNDPFFKGGFVSKWDAMAFQWKAAVGSTLRAIMKLFGQAFEFIQKGVSAFFENVFNLGAKAGAAFASLLTLDADKIAKAFAEARQAFDELLDFGDIDLGLELQEAFDPVLLARNEIARRLEAVRSAFASGKTDISKIIEIVAEVIRATQTGDIISSAEIVQMIKDVLGETAFDAPEEDVTLPGSGNEFDDEPEVPEVVEEDTTADVENKEAVKEQTVAIEEETIVEEEQAIEKTKNVAETKKQNKVIKEVVKLTARQKELLAEGAAAVKKYNLDIKVYTGEVVKASDATADGTKAEGEHTKKTETNSFNLAADSRTIIKDIDFLKLQIIEIARNTNILSLQTTMIAKVNVMWANVIAQGNRAAGKLASLKVSSKGIFSITDPGVSKADQDAINNAMRNHAATLGAQISIDINLLKTELESIKVVLEEANTIAEKAQESVKEAGENVSQANNAVSDADLNAKLADFNTFLTGGKTPVVATNAEGIQQLDVNVDGIFDIDIKNGALTDEQVEELSDRFGDKIADALKDALGVEVV